MALDVMGNPRCWRITVVLAIACAIGACSSAVVVESRFPTPLVERLPVRVGLIFDEELYNYIHAEDIPQQSTWTIDLGDANVAMLEPLFQSMFMAAPTLTDMAAASAQRDELDGILQPELEKFEFDVPIGQRDEFVEVWMQYKLKLYRPDGQLVTEWPVSGYGKYELSGKRTDAVERAAIVAMREAGATISTKFAEQPDISYWLEERRDAHSERANAAVTN
jgi:hypothetical protein